MLVEFTAEQCPSLDCRQRRKSISSLDTNTECVQGNELTIPSGVFSRPKRALR